MLRLKHKLLIKLFKKIRNKKNKLFKILNQLMKTKINKQKIKIYKNFKMNHYHNLLTVNLIIREIEGKL